jgi:hypothetical protein
VGEDLADHRPLKGRSNDLLITAEVRAMRQVEVKDARDHSGQA